ncbi:hypothetical protein PC129_g22194 [Phytophthora cactorum]|uniref:Reverse transcriptase/retrotransposon-derived protein RNase H-like domain-containing protein n=1 Tax=Phytophthora cactorum TaxID=29920 RepID=A0A329RDY4_9STRA|nr:hypothetical protein Pcac1_g12077 [Phytophthora cactorum]KAG2796947.1 hypothetical protein PC111_g21500 [Phytophthora cactorum]KAG2797107.1 hypothetical protein PC112_g21928 [Phytophthora cactorum]KAG2826455.1 hypothetical protein PC113_g21762 [Phytophthora cactorum]KAG2876378.1 hypothetical protein PC114_g24226 [Phytophthora cactorum]
MFTLLNKKDKRNAKIHFNDEQLKNFNELKRRLCNPPVLHLPVFSQPMHLRTDASKFAVGGVLFHVVDGIERPIAYTSRKMKPAELNYPTQQQQLLAIVHALAAFRIYCLGKPPIVETDYKSLEGFGKSGPASLRSAASFSQSEAAEKEQMDEHHTPIDVLAKHRRFAVVVAGFSPNSLDRPPPLRSSGLDFPL